MTYHWSLLITLLPYACAQGSRNSRLQALADASVLPLKLYPSRDMPLLREWNGSASHNPTSKHVIFSLNFPDRVFGMYKIESFLGSARKFHDGDIVLALPINAKKEFVQAVSRYDVIVYFLDVREVAGPQDVPMFYFSHLSSDTAVPLAQTRYMLYQYWALKYHRQTTILVSDFRDVFFQSNPFIYAEDVWNRQGTKMTSAKE